jgi:hypothetical protein
MKTKYVNIMNTKYVVATLFAILVSMTGCDKGFEELNKNPLLLTSINPVYELVTAENMFSEQTHYYSIIVQQVGLIIGGQEAGGNFNIRNDNFMNSMWGSAYGNIKELTAIINTLEGNPDRTNLYNMARILKAYNAMLLVDTYGDVPYSEAGQALDAVFLPKYDGQQAIYTDIETELKAATDALDATKKIETGDMFFKGDIAKWKKFGNSLLLRLGMRYSKSNTSKAQSIVQTATDATRGGVITTNDDNVYIPYNATQNNPGNSGFLAGTKHNWHAGRPFVDYMYTNRDPRMQYIVCRYSDPSSASGGTIDTVLSHQVGSPYGYDESTISTDPLYPGMIGSAYKYSQLNRQRCLRVDAWHYLVTAAQTQLLMAEARYRGWITTSTAQAYYENGITQALSEKDIFSDTRGGASPITPAQITAYLARPNIAYADATALKQINEQYWLASFLTWHEGWCNFRRSGYPQLTRMNYSKEDADVHSSADGFIHRMCYTGREYSVNKDNVTAAATAIGGDKLTTRVLWDTP